MALFRGNEKEKDSASNKITIKNIHQAPYTRRYDDYNGLTITYLDANYGSIDTTDNNTKDI